MAPEKQVRWMRVRACVFAAASTSADRLDDVGAGARARYSDNGHHRHDNENNGEKRAAKLAPLPRLCASPRPARTCLHPRPSRRMSVLERVLRSIRDETRDTDHTGAAKLTNDHLAALYVAVGGDAALLDATLEFAARDAHRVTIHAHDDERRFALVRPADPRLTTPYVCVAGEFCTCGSGGSGDGGDGESGRCKHALGAAILVATGSQTVQRVYHYESAEAYERALVTAIAPRAA